eukprot:1121600-Heterocapsa_arctica.AAC.1
MLLQHQILAKHGNGNDQGKHGRGGRLEHIQKESLGSTRIRGNAEFGRGCRQSTGLEKPEVSQRQWRRTKVNKAYWTVSGKHSGNCEAASLINKHTLGGRQQIFWKHNFPNNKSQGLMTEGRHTVE